MSKQGSKSPAFSLVVRPFSSRFTVKVSTWSYRRREQIKFPTPCMEFLYNWIARFLHRDFITHTIRLSSCYRKEHCEDRNPHTSHRKRILILPHTGKGLEFPLSPVLLDLFLGCPSQCFHCNSQQKLSLFHCSNSY